jgi:hypothetical protein
MGWGRDGLWGWWVEEGVGCGGEGLLVKEGSLLGVGKLVGERRILWGGRLVVRGLVDVRLI